MEINRERLQHISLLLAVLGTAGMLGYSLVQEAVEISIPAITEQQVGKQVWVSGRVGELYSTPDFIRFSLHNQGILPAITFNPSLTTRVKLEQDAWIRARGEIARYQGTLELVVEEVETVD